ncbi:hypothetical protein ACPPVO_00375 [Dactylosporangium sp. McL0621]|uniref:hypothetical protein n=1 Tax=Dactylosporangium sp. McL0621 TaxID=3415678 RepID=UPI003CF681BA
MRHIELELELESSRRPDSPLSSGAWIGHDRYEGIEITVNGREDGHGFGFSEIVTIAMSVASGVTIDLLSDAIRTAAGGAIRKVRGRRRRSDGSAEGVAGVLQDEIGDPDSDPDTAGDR